jgi:hypothetical protein
MLFVSLFAYAAAKNAGLQGRDFREVDRHWQEHPDSSPWACYRTLAAARTLEELNVMTSGHTLITKARSVAAGLFLASNADVWLTCDDDVYADSDVLERLLSVVRETRGIASVPCALRSGVAINVTLPLLAPVRALGKRAHVVQALRSGLGLVAMHKDAIRAMAGAVPHVTVGGDYPALFLEHVSSEGAWVGEDIAFTSLASELGVAMHALLDAPCNHAGRWAQLTRDLEVLVGDTDTAGRIGQ